MFAVCVRKIVAVGRRTAVALSAQRLQVRVV